MFWTIVFLYTFGGAIMMLFSGIIIDVGLTAIFAHFGWQMWKIFMGTGAVFGFLKGLVGDRSKWWIIPDTLVLALCGFLCGKFWMIDGIIYAAILFVFFVKAFSLFSPSKFPVFT